MDRGAGGLNPRGHMESDTTGTHTYTMEDLPQVNFLDLCFLPDTDRIVTPVRMILGLTHLPEDFQSCSFQHHQDGSS